MPITKLSLANVGPFEQIDFDFDHQVNVFTGPNNTGKSSALWALGDIAVYPFLFPTKLLRQDAPAKFAIDLQSQTQERSLVGELPCSFSGSSQVDEAPGYWTVERSKKYVAFLSSIGYSKFIPALRWSTDFRSPGPALGKREEGETENKTRVSYTHRPESRLVGSRYRAQGESDPELRRRLTLVSEDASLVSDEAVIQEIVDLDYRSYLRGEGTFRRLIDQIGEIASQVTDGFLDRFSGVREDEDGFFPEFRTQDGNMPLNAVSQGTQSIIQWLAHLVIGYATYYDFPQDLRNKPGILIVDEIDAHLHPSWQRRIIPALTSHFPKLQIFCSTHSPLMLAGLKAGQIQLLKRDDAGRVTVIKSEEGIVGWSADEILRNCLGVQDPTDQQTAAHLERLRELRRKDELRPEESKELELLREAVGRQLVDSPMYGQVEQIVQAIKGQSDSVDR